MSGTGAMLNNGGGTGFGGGGRGPWRASQQQGSLAGGAMSNDALLQLKQQLAAGVSWVLSRLDCMIFILIGPPTH